MQTRTRLIVAGIVSCVFFIIVFAPASVITNRLPGKFRLAGVDGTLWNGHIRSLDIDGWQLRDTRWNLHPTALLLGRFSASVATRIAGGEISADASISIFGAISIRDLEAAGPIAPLAVKLNLPVTGGRYQVHMTELLVTDGWPEMVVGTARVTGVPLNIMGSDGPTGGYTVSFDTESVVEDGRISGLLADDGGPIEVGGTIVLTPPANYAVQAKLKARPGAPAEITQALMLVGPVGPDGRRDIALSGSL